MSLLQYAEPGGEYLIPWAKNKLKLMRGEMLRAGRASAHKVVYVSDSSVIYMDSLYLGRGQFRDSIRITAQSGYSGQWVFSTLAAIRTKGLRLGKNYTSLMVHTANPNTNSNGWSNGWSRKYETFVTTTSPRTAPVAVLSQSTFKVTRMAEVADPANGVLTHDDVTASMASVAVMNAAGTGNSIPGGIFGPLSTHGAYSPPYCAMSPDGAILTAAAGPTAVGGFFLQDIRWNKSSNTWATNASIPGPVDAVAATIAALAPGTIVIKDPSGLGAFNAFNPFSNNPGILISTLYPVALRYGDPNGRSSSTPVPPGGFSSTSYLNSDVTVSQPSTKWDPYTGDVTAIFKVHLITSHTMTDYGVDIRHSFGGLLVYLGYKYSVSTQAWSEVGRVTIPTAFETREVNAVPIPPNVGTPYGYIGSDSGRFYQNGFVYPVSGRIAIGSDIGDDTTKILVATPDGVKMLSWASQIVSTVTQVPTTFFTGSSLVTVNIVEGIFSGSVPIATNNPSTTIVDGQGNAVLTPGDGLFGSYIIYSTGAGGTYAITRGAPNPAAWWKYPTGTLVLSPADLTGGGQLFMSKDGRRLWSTGSTSKYFEDGVLVWDGSTSGVDGNGNVIAPSGLYSMDLMNAFGNDDPATFWAQATLPSSDLTGTLQDIASIYKFVEVSPPTNPRSWKIKRVASLAPNFGTFTPFNVADEALIPLPANIHVSVDNIIPDGFYPAV